MKIQLVLSINIKKDLKIIYNRNQKNLGFALNAIKAVKLSKGKYAWLIGNDDLILPNTLNDLKKFFKITSKLIIFL